MVGRWLVWLLVRGFHELQGKFLFSEPPLMSELRSPKTNSNKEDVGLSNSPRGSSPAVPELDRGGNTIMEGTNKEGNKARSSRNKSHTKPTTDGDRKQAGVRSRVVICSLNCYGFE